MKPVRNSSRTRELSVHPDEMPASACNPALIYIFFLNDTHKMIDALAVFDL